ncbi:MAG: glucosamine-6-phosphate deaminase [Oscillospiraceae bacterium]|nr:glucosamine-6-phosphate deaminase [Oscillospiraceae bacterium]MBR5251939.1 glucosamine-6-phosphate deaminase [Oscillospiraceae bacterium]
MRVIVTKNYEELGRVAANIIASQVTLKPDSVLGLATGSSPISTYQNLIKKYENGDLDFSKCHTANLDEYVGLTKDNDQSYAYFMYENLFRHINIDMANTNIPDGTNPDAEGECARYDAVVESLGGVDIQLLGIGHNGHVGFNEPADCFAKGTNMINLTQSTIDANTRFFAKKEDVPTKAYTMGIKTIMSAKKVLLVANGEGKAEIIYKMVAGDITPQVPASVLQLHNDTTVVVDEAAAKILAEKAPHLITG